MKFKNKWSIQEVQAIVTSSQSFVEVQEKMNLGSNNGVRQFIHKHNINYSHFSYGQCAKLNDEEFALLVQQCKSIAEVIRSLGLEHACGGNYGTIGHRIHRLNLDTSHFTGPAWNRGIYETFDNLTHKKAMKNNLLREYGHKCQSCQLSTWLDNPIYLELHHINGVRKDNRKENLQLLCPNCHALTGNYRNRKRE